MSLFIPVAYKSVLCKKRNLDQWNKTGGKYTQWGKDNLFNKWCWENWTTPCKRMKLEHFLTPYIKINAKWIIDLNVRPETIKLIEENIGRTLDIISQSKILYDPHSRVMEIKRKVNKWELIN